MFSDPDKVAAHFGLAEGSRVADFGAGSGAYTIAAAKRVGSHGKVFAVDVQKNLLDRLASTAREARLGNVEVVWGNIEKRGGSTLTDESVDCVILANILFQSDAKYTLLLEARRVLRPGGTLAIVEWSDSFGGLGPAPDRVVAPEEVKKVAAEAGLMLVKDFPAGEQHYGLLFRRA